ncbi:MAG TPA: alkaline phosphatase family protein [Vicinamibacterales bacterium]
MKRTLLAFLTLVVATSAAFTAPAAPQPTQGGKPSLVVLLVVDQMRRDYLDLYGARWSKGFRRLYDEGAWFPNAAYPYSTTLTCAGHATIATGALPRTHGVISNQWWDRASQQLVSCTSDRSAREVPYGDRQAGSGGSASSLKAPTLASAIASATGGRVVSISLKRAAAAMLAGTGRGDAVLWFQGGGWSSSTAWASKPERAMLRAATRAPIESDFGRIWARRHGGGHYEFEDDGLGEKPSPEWTTVFPHALQPRDGRPTLFFYEAWQSSPYSDGHLERLALAAIDDMKLGRDSGIDVLAVSFSALDVVGHDFGPRSHEIQDVLFRLDETFDRLLDRLDRRVGRGRYVVAFTADHGVAVIPEQAARDGADAGRIRMNELIRVADETLAEPFGRGRWTATEAYSEFYFRGGVFDRILATPGLLGKVKDALAAQPGVARVYDRTEVPTLAESGDALARAVAAGFFPERSGDLIVVPKPNWIFVADDKTVIPGNATTHGTGYAYDTDVPLVIFGAGVKPGRYEGAASPADIAPTLAHIAGVALPSATGRVLAEALATAPATEAAGPR